LFGSSPIKSEKSFEYIPVSQWWTEHNKTARWRLLSPSGDALCAAAFDDDIEEPRDACDCRTGDESREGRREDRADLEFIVPLFVGDKIVHFVIDADKARSAPFILLLLMRPL